jgi:hypothetical protein
MPECRPSNDAQPLGSAARRNTFHDRSLPGFLLIALLYSGEALADEHASNPGAAPGSTVAGLRQFPPATAAAIADPGSFALPKDAGVPRFSSTEFRPRKRTIFDRDPVFGTSADVPILENTTVWQRMSEYRSQDRVRLLTLWETSGGAVSLQAGRHGDPSLQWNSRLMNHDGSTRGVFDRLLSVSLGGAHNGAHSATPASSAPAALKPAGNPVVAGLK